MPTFVCRSTFPYQRNIGCICSFSRLNSTYKSNYLAQMYTKNMLRSQYLYIHHLIFSWTKFTTPPVTRSQERETPPVDASHHAPSMRCPLIPPSMNSLPTSLPRPCFVQPPPPYIVVGNALATPPIHGQANLAAGVLGSREEVNPNSSKCAVMDGSMAQGHTFTQVTRH